MARVLSFIIIIIIIIIIIMSACYDSSKVASPAMSIWTKLLANET